MISGLNAAAANERRRTRDAIVPVRRAAVGFSEIKSPVSIQPTTRQPPEAPGTLRTGPPAIGNNSGPCDVDTATISPGGPVFRVDPATGQRNPWADIQPRDPSGIMTLSLTSLVVTPDGRSYGYFWHRATSELYLVKGWH